MTHQRHDDAQSARVDTDTAVDTPSATAAGDGPVLRAGRRLLSRLARLDRLLERGTVELFGASDAHTARRQRTGLPALDDVLGGGLPVGRLVEIAGAPASGKTLLALALCRAAQEDGGVAAFIDVEHGLSNDVVTRAGVWHDRLVVARPDGGEQALQVVDELLRARAASLIVVDSVSALVPAAELTGVVGAAPAGHLSRLMSQSLRRLALQAAKAGAVVVFVNQFRRTWDDDGKGRQTTTGGAALHYVAATRLVVMGDSARDGVAGPSSTLSVLVTKARFGGAGAVVSVGSLLRAALPETTGEAVADARAA
jgi:recombination protein RecA